MADLASPEGFAAEDARLQALIDGDYDLSLELAEPLEAMVHAQLAHGHYSGPCNLALVRMYQAHPHAAKESMYTAALTLGLAALPALDLLAMQYLLPPSARDADGVREVLELAELAETARYPELFARVRASPPAAPFPHLRAKLQRCALCNIRETFRRVELPIFLALVDAADAAAAAELAAAHPDLVEGVDAAAGMVTMRACRGNTPAEEPQGGVVKERGEAEATRYEDVLRLLVASRVGVVKERGE
eukprot:CAMPEP_0198428970 /NCGR_PEP_ID=MMETSP1452-20131203/6892_1 /TAXON_ID=1181717 /ORGANISM="Synchroma pusillum, Strain CCMP3072" /LENGTH=246 /DNA_ID=CAMNT_0044149371 /DNA_START=1 /DNA_END=738 /DNA_ORIENTATION=-